MTVAKHQLMETVDRAIKKLIAHDASWSRILAKDLHRALHNLKKKT